MVRSRVGVGGAGRTGELRESKGCRHGWRNYLNLGVFICLEVGDSQMLRYLSPRHLPPGVGQLSTILRVKTGNAQKQIGFPLSVCQAGLVALRWGQLHRPSVRPMMMSVE